MKVFKIKVADIDAKLAALFTGHVSINMPSYKERLALVRDMKVDPNEATSSGLQILEMVEKHVAEVDLKTSAGEVIKSFDELGYIAEGVQLINALGMTFIRGVSLSGK